MESKDKEPNGGPESIQIEGKSKKKWSVHVNRSYIPLKLIYFFFMGGESCALLYRAIFMKHLGMSTKQTGIIWTIERIISVILPPFLGAITDKSRRPKMVLITLLISGSLLIFCMYFVPQEEYISTNYNSSISTEEINQGNVSMCWNFDCNTTKSAPPEQNICSVQSVTRWNGGCEDDYNEVAIGCTREDIPLTNTTSRENSSENIVESYQYSCSLNTGNVSIVVQLSNQYTDILINAIPNANVYQSQTNLCVVYNGISTKIEPSECSNLQVNPVDEYGITFWLLFGLVILSSFTTIGSYPVIESSVLGVLGPANRHKFGNQRLWASVGYGSGALIVGFFKDRTSDAVNTTVSSNLMFLPMFIGVVMCWSCASVVAAKLPIKTSHERTKVRLKDIKFVLSNPKAIAFLVFIIIYGASIAVQEIYLFWLAEIKLNAPTFILGASTFVGAMLDIPFCLAAGRLVRKFGHTSLLCFGIFAFSIRLFLCSIVTSPLQLIFAESLRCISWGLTWVVACSYTAKISPKGLEALTMGLTQAALWGVGYSSGALIGGVLFQTIGGDNLFRLMAVMGVISSLLYGLFHFFIRDKKKRKREEVEEEEELKIPNTGAYSPNIEVVEEEVKVIETDNVEQPLVETNSLTNSKQ